MEPKYVRARVSGDVPIRDVLTRESVEPGGEVTLLVRVAGESLPRCPRHPKRGPQDNRQPCYCHGTLLEGLIEQGLIADVRAHDPKKPAEKPKA